MDTIAYIFELGGWAYLGPFSQYMYKANLYLTPFLSLLLIPIVVLLIYYKIWDNISFAKTKIWLAVVLVSSLVIGAIGFNCADSGLYDYLNAHHITNSKIMDEDYITFSFICFGLSMVWFFFLSLIFKNISVKSRHVPF